MTLVAEYPAEVYRKASRALRQGDIAICEFSQLRPRSGERPGPGPDSVAAPDLEAFGKFIDSEIDVPQPDGTEAKRVVRVWSGFAMVVEQNCAIEHASSNDSRLLVAPLASPAIWPAGPWEWLRRNRLPGYLYLPGLDEKASAFVGLEVPWSESVAVLSGISLVSRALVKPRRVLSLSGEMLPHLQEKLSRHLSVRGFASDRELEGLVGKRVSSVQRTDATVTGPSRLYKLFLEDREGGDGDEAAVTVGCRPV